MGSRPSKKQRNVDKKIMTITFESIKIDEYNVNVNYDHYMDPIHIYFIIACACVYHSNPHAMDDNHFGKRPIPSTMIPDNYNIPDKYTEGISNRTDVYEVLNKLGICTSGIECVIQADDFQTDGFQTVDLRKYDTTPSKFTFIMKYILPRISDNQIDHMLVDYIAYLIIVSCYANPNVLFTDFNYTDDDDLDNDAHRMSTDAYRSEVSKFLKTNVMGDFWNIFTTHLYDKHIISSKNHLREWMQRYDAKMRYGIFRFLNVDLTNSTDSEFLDFIDIYGIWVFIEFLKTLEKTRANEIFLRIVKYLNDNNVSYWQRTSFINYITTYHYTEDAKIFLQSLVEHVIWHDHRFIKLFRESPIALSRTTCMIAVCKDINYCEYVPKSMYDFMQKIALIVVKNPDENDVKTFLDRIIPASNIDDINLINM